MEQAPLMGELLDEFVEQISADIDGWQAVLDALARHDITINRERMGAVIDRLEDVRDAVREMREQGE